MAVCGDVGHARSPQFAEFMRQVSDTFEKVFFVPGNHEFGLGTTYNRKAVTKLEPVLRHLCRRLGNVDYLDRETAIIRTPGEDITVAGSILWSRPMPSVTDPMYDGGVGTGFGGGYLEHVAEHTAHVEWLTQVLRQHETKRKVVVLTHFVPTFRLIEPRFKKLGLRATSRYATDLEHLFRPPLHAWLCGHTHSVLETTVNGIPTAVNAFGYSGEGVPQTKVIDL